MLRCIFITSLLLFITTFSYGQFGGQSMMQQGNQQRSQSRANDDYDDEEEEQTEPKIFVLKDQGISLGIDLSPFIMRIFNEERTGLAFVGRYGFGNRWYGAAEAGYENTKYKTDTYDYKSNGTFIRVGMDYDIWNSEDFPTNDNIFIGMRYDYAWQNHSCDKYTIVDDYWGNYESSVSNNSVNSHALEVLFGLRCEMLPNFYMGWSFRFKFLLASAHDEILDPYAIAGYGKYDSKAGMGFTYTLEYQIPFNKKKKQ